MMKTNNFALLTIAAISIGIPVIDVDRATAAIINYDLTVNNLDGSLLGSEFTGEFSFDDAGLSGSGTEFLPVSDLSFEFQGTTFDETDDISSSTEVEFFDGEFLGLSYSTDVEFSFIPGFFSLSESFFAYDFGGGDAGTGDVTYTLDDTPTGTDTTVPEPTTIFGLLATVGLFTLGSQKKKYLR